MLTYLLGYHRGGRPSARGLGSIGRQMGQLGRRGSLEAFELTVRTLGTSTRPPVIV
jgi:hypothetical protein